MRSLASLSPRLTPRYPQFLTRTSSQILDLKGTSRNEQNDLLDSFVTSTSTKPELEQTSFLSSLDMDPPASGTVLQLQTSTSPGGSRVSLPGLLAGPGPAEGILAALSSPPLSGTPSGAETPPRADGHAPAGKREVFSDFRRFVSFGLRRDTAPPS